MRPNKLEHICARCGNISVVERAARFRDDDFIELLHDYMDLERLYRRDVARLELAISKLEWLAEDRAATAGYWQALAEAWRQACEEEQRQAVKYPDE